MHVLEMDATDLVECIATGDLKVLEVVDAAIDACERLNPSLNAVFSTRFERARDEAEGAATTGNPHPYVNAAATGDWTFGRDDIVTLDASVPPGTPMEIFQRGRWDPASSPTQQWDIPIDAGKEIEHLLIDSNPVGNSQEENQNLAGTE